MKISSPNSLQMVADPGLPAAQPGTFTPVAHLRRLRQCQQVAAVCYRIRANGIEFLLVQTRGGRWTFPKGGAARGLTHAQSAALEAFEEAGVHGRIEEACFARYIHHKASSSDGPRRGSRGKELSVSAHLCEVRTLSVPLEDGRNPTWFSPEKAKRRLCDERPPEFGRELARVLDGAISRIQHVHAAAAAAAKRAPILEMVPRWTQRRLSAKFSPLNPAS